MRACRLLAREGDYVNAARALSISAILLPETEKDFVAVAERFLGVPYVWGGKTAAGLDCSGLIQTALQAAGKAAPRDTDMMEKALGEGVAMARSRRGDLVFWKGHMGVMLDEKRLLHANAFHMMVAIEPLAEAIARIEAVAGPVTQRQTALILALVRISRTDLSLWAIHRNKRFSSASGQTILRATSRNSTTRT